jgi:hypothetical protein
VGREDRGQLLLSTSLDNRALRRGHGRIRDEARWKRVNTDTAGNRVGLYIPM